MKDILFCLSYIDIGCLWKRCFDYECLSVRVWSASVLVFHMPSCVVEHIGEHMTGWLIGCHAWLLL